MQHSGKHAFVTGGGTGIGLAIARALAAEGAEVTITGRRQEVLDQVAGGRIHAMAMDVTDEAAQIETIAGRLQNAAPFKFVLQMRALPRARHFKKPTWNFGAKS